MTRPASALLLLTALLTSPFALASGSVFDDAVWDLGAGIGGLRYHLYPGSADEDSFLIPTPYLTYRSPLLEIDRGIKSFFYTSDDLLLDISADFALPVDSSDSGARQGMPDLNAVLQIGPSVEFLFGDDDYDVRLELPARVALATDLTDNDNLGWVFEPRLSVEHRRTGRKGIDWKVSGGLMYSSADYHAYYYDVPAAFATGARNEYRSAGGYSGAFVSLRGSYRIGDWIVWSYLRMHTLDGSVIEDSPLVERSLYRLVGLGVSWIFASSL